MNLSVELKERMKDKGFLPLMFKGIVVLASIEALVVIGFLGAYLMKPQSIPSETTTSLEAPQARTPAQQD